MGTPISPLVDPHEINNEDLVEKKRKTAVVDSYIWMYQFLHKIKDHDTGEPLKDDEGRITSHLIGFWNRTINLMDDGIDPIFVFDGSVPQLKQEEIEKRQRSKKQAQEEWEEARAMGDREKMRSLEIRRRGITGDMIDHVIDLIDAMGCPHVIAPEEADSQCAMMNETDVVDYTISTDWDTMLYGSPNMLKALDSDSCQYVRLESILSSNDLTLEEFRWMGITLGTDYNSSPTGVGPKRGMSIVQESTSFEEVIEGCRQYDSIDEDRWFETLEMFRDPVVQKTNPEREDPDDERLFDLLVEKHGFDRKRTVNQLSRITTRSLNEF